MAAPQKLAPFKDEILDAYKRGDTLRLIGERYGVTESAVCIFIKRSHVPKREEDRFTRWTEERREAHGAKFRGRVPHNKGKRYKFTKKRRSPDITGSRNPGWKGGVTPECRLLRASADYKEWRLKVFERDNFTCTLCGDRCRKGNKPILHADHIKPFAAHPELRFDVSNGRTLCKPCHMKTPTYGVNLRYLVPAS